MPSPADHMLAHEYIHFLEGYVEQMELHAQLEIEFGDKRSAKYRTHKAQAETCGRILKKIREFTDPVQKSTQLGEEDGSMASAPSGASGPIPVPPHPKRAEA